MLSPKVPIWRWSSTNWDFFVHPTVHTCGVKLADWNNEYVQFAVSAEKNQEFPFHCERPPREVNSTVWSLFSRFWRCLILGLENHSEQRITSVKQTIAIWPVMWCSRSPLLILCSWNHYSLFQHGEVSTFDLKVMKIVCLVISGQLLQGAFQDHTGKIGVSLLALRVSYYMYQQFLMWKTYKQKDRQTERKTDRQTDRQAGRQTGTQAGWQTGRQTDKTDRQTARQTDS